MFAGFFRKKVSIHSVAIPDLGWSKSKEEKTAVQWMNPDETIAVSIHYFDHEPDIPTIKDIHGLRDFYREIIFNVQGGIIEVELKKNQGLDIARTLVKIPRQPTGILYVGALTIPFRVCSFVIKVQAVESSLSGFRETMIADRLFKNGEELSSTWLYDPYDPKFKKGALMNRSEEQVYDAEFPDHPLSRVRQLLDQIEREFTWEPAVGKLPRFGK